MNSLFIESKDLGSVLESALSLLPLGGTARQRQRDFRRLCDLLKTLKILPPNSVPVSLGMGVAVSGRVGLIITYELTKIEGKVMP